MLKREAETELKDFFMGKAGKCLVVRGARQVGKTSLVQKTVKDVGFDSYLEINFLERPDLKQIFSGALDVNTLLLNFSVFLPESRFVPGNTVLFLDEIQECPEAVTALKFLAKDERIRVAASGSMLGIDYNRPSSYPVGSVSYLDLKPMSFKEFLWALGINDQVISMLHDSFESGTPVPEAVNQQMLKYLKLYMTVGGMPEVVQLFVDTHDLRQVDERQRALLEDYRNDIAHYAPPAVKIKAEKCYFSLKDQLGKENHKFQYSVVEHGGSRRKFGNALDWLYSADLIIGCSNVRTPESPLDAFEDPDDFRLYPTDIGMFTAMYDYSLKQMLFSDNGSSPLGQAKGGLYEALVACMLSQRNGRKLYFYK
ncbi:MAG: ATP-binding protein, partial [Candidatus Weimeria sp.]